VFAVPVRMNGEQLSEGAHKSLYCKHLTGDGMTTERAHEKEQLREQPPSRMVEVAVERSRESPCQSKRGVVLFRENLRIGSGFNHRLVPTCDGSAACKATCRQTAIHAEQHALIRAGLHAQGCDALHVKTVNGTLVPSGPPSCVECSKLLLVAGVLGVWLFHEDGWRRYEIVEFHRLSLAAAEQRATRAENALAVLRVNHRNTGEGLSDEIHKRKRAEQRATTAEQKLKHGYFGDTYESLLASWREQDQALQDIYGACGTEENVGCPGDVARIAIEALTSSEGLRHQLEQPIPHSVEVIASYVIGGWREKANTVAAIGSAVIRGMAASPIAEVVVTLEGVGSKLVEAEEALKASEGLRERLRHYVRHTPQCRLCISRDPLLPCNCGLADLLAAIPTGEER